MKKVLYTAAIIAVTSLHPLPAHAQDANDSAEAAVMNVINYGKLFNYKILMISHNL